MVQGGSVIHEFYTVTSTSIYRVADNQGAGPGEAVKIISKGESGVSSGRKLKGGTMVAVARSLVAYHPSTNRSFDAARSCDWGGRTSWIVALFKEEEAAKRCLEHGSSMAYDRRWIESTLEVLREIGDNHPWFCVARGDLRPLV